MLSPIEEIKAKVDIVDVISEYFPLKQSGSNFKARCPFHEEKTPSFMVSREKQFYHCFGCHESGDIFTFIQKMEGVEFPEALKILANKAGVKIASYNPAESNLRTKLLSANEQAAEWFSEQLFNTAVGKKALSYLKEKRKLEDETIREWKIGYALQNWDGLTIYLRSKNFSDEEIIQSGLVATKQKGQGIYDRFRDRIMFPIEDYHGNIVGFTGRAVKDDEAAKYINTPQTTIYNKSEVIYGLYKAKQAIKEKDEVVIVEGNMDVIASHAAGVKNAVAISGTALSQEQIKLLGRLTNNFIFAFDSDEAGMRAARRSIELAWQTEVNVRVIGLDTKIGKDPDEIIRKDKKVWQRLITEAKPAMDYFFEFFLRDYRAGEIESKKRVASELLNLIIKLANPIEEDIYIKKLAEKLESREESLREIINRTRSKSGGRQSEQQVQNQKESVVNQPVDKKLVLGQRLLAYMLMEIEYAEYIVQNIRIEYLPFELHGLYKQLVVHYTKGEQKSFNIDNLELLIKKQSPDLIDKFRALIFLKDSLGKEFSYNESLAEVKNYVANLKREFIKDRMRQIQKEVREAEAAMAENKDIQESQNLEEKVNRLMREYNDLSVELK